MRIQNRVLFCVIIFAHWMQKERKENKKMFLIHSKVERSMKAMGKKKKCACGGFGIRDGQRWNTEMQCGADRCSYWNMWNEATNTRTRTHVVSSPNVNWNIVSVTFFFWIHELRHSYKFRLLWILIFILRQNLINFVEFNYSFYSVPFGHNSVALFNRLFICKRDHRPNSDARAIRFVFERFVIV